VASALSQAAVRGGDTQQLREALDVRGPPLAPPAPLSLAGVCARISPPVCTPVMLWWFGRLFESARAIVGQAGLAMGLRGPEVEAAQAACEEMARQDEEEEAGGPRERGTVQLAAAADSRPPGIDSADCQSCEVVNLSDGGGGVAAAPAAVQAAEHAGCPAGMELSLWELLRGVGLAGAAGGLLENGFEDTFTVSLAEAQHLVGGLITAEVRSGRHD
jgi:hypothetical protein